MNAYTRVYNSKLRYCFHNSIRTFLPCNLRKSFSTSFPALKQCSISRNVHLNYDTYDDDTTQQIPVVVCHGLFGNKHNWRQLNKQIHSASGRKVICYDAVNHGLSSHHTHMSYLDMSHDLIQLLDKLDIEKAILIGHSMGGKTVMTTALSHPTRIEKAVVVDTVPKETPSTGEVYGYLEAMGNIDMSQISSRKMVQQELEKVVSSSSLILFLMSNLVRVGKNFSWRININAMKQNYPHIHSFPHFDDGVTYDQPTLFIGGSRSYYITQNEYPSIWKYFPGAKVEHVPDAGHWVHSEKPEEFLKLVLPFIT